MECEAVNLNDEVVLHSDNGGPMIGTTILATMQKLGVVPSFSHPSVRNDNPFSDSLFKMLKYVPTYPSKPFESVEETRQWVTNFTEWYNHSHHHSGLELVAPEQRHSGENKAILKRREAVYKEAKRQHPERWSGETRNWNHDAVVRLNPVNEKLECEVKKAA